MAAVSSRDEWLSEDTDEQFASKRRFEGLVNSP